ncbi:MAG: LysM peptidoglycan-binding domain-containing protein [Treponema sp.]|jgi:hypothetical protein|nr:LysM peptidoglycan-binding domain-containing protein [Treponema sp.]
MRKLFLFSIVLLSMFWVVSCKTTPPAPPPPVEEPEVSDEYNSAFSEVYGKYRKYLDLEGAQTYIVQKGDTLVRITTEFYSRDNRWYFPLIMMASYEVVEDPDLLEPGMELTIPDLQRNLASDTAHGMLKQFLLEIADVYENKAADKEAAGSYDQYHQFYVTSRDGLRTLSDTL